MIGLILYNVVIMATYLFADFLYNKGKYIESLVLIREYDGKNEKIHGFTDRIRLYFCLCQ